MNQAVPMIQLSPPPYDNYTISTLIIHDKYIILLSQFGLTRYDINNDNHSTITRFDHGERTQIEYCHRK